MDKVGSKLDALLKRATEGDIEAQCELGEYYEAKDNVQSFNWYQKAADQGSLDASYILAYMYEEGLGVDADLSKALDLYKRCAEHRKRGTQDEKELGFSACKEIAIYYDEGKGRDKDLARAIYWYEQASKGIALEANEYRKIGRFYESGENIKPDLAKAVHWYEKAADYKRLSELYQEDLLDVGKARYYAGKCLKRKERMDTALLADNLFSLDTSAVVESFMHYYKEIYPSEIQTVCRLKLMTDRGEIPFARDFGRDLVKNGSRALKEHFCFLLAAVYLRSLFPQVAGKVLGKSSLFDTYMSTGWQWLGCGTDELMNPIHIVRKAHLYPAEAELDAFLLFFSQVKRFAIDDFLTFLRGKQANLNQVAYDHLVHAAYGSLWEIEHECLVQTDLFECWIKDPLFPYELKLI